MNTALSQGISALGLDIDAATQEHLQRYIQLMFKWNKVYNLTAIRNSDEMVSLHLLDSLTVLPHLPPGRLADVGSGAGLPGIPIALCQPERPVTLIERSQKKSTFQQQAKIELQIHNLNVHCGRVELFQPTPLFDVVISRAFSAIDDFIAVAGHLLAPNGCLVAMKGQFPEHELRALPPGFHVEHCQKLSVPGLNAERHLLRIRRS